MGLYDRVRLRLARGRINGGTYERQTAVRAVADLGLVDVDEDLGMTQRTTTSITGDDFVLDPPDRLFVYQIDGCEGLRLYRSNGQPFLKTSQP